MKKLLFFYVFLCFFINVSALNMPELISVSNKCSVIDDNRVIIPVRVLAKNKGMFSSVVNQYVLGKIDNTEDMIIKINNLKSDYVSNVKIDYKKDSEKRSYINYYVDKDITIEKLDTFLEFDLEIEFKSDILNRVYVLGNEIVLDENKEVCEYINGYEFKEIEKVEYIDNNSNNYYFIILVLIFILIVIIIFRKKK